MLLRIVLAPFLLILFSLSICFTALGTESWYPYPVQDQDRKVFEYKPLSTSSREWKICVSFPHIKDAYWLAVNFGVSAESKRLGIAMELFHAGGYEHLNKQISQIRECVRNGGEGVVIGAISLDGLNDLVSELKQQNIPVVDLVNGISSQDVAAKSLVSFKEMAATSGGYIANRHVKEKQPAKIAWFPGPGGAGWVKAGDEGFRMALTNTNTEIITTRFGDTGFSAQRVLIEDVLKKHPDIDYIVGTAVTIEAAIPALRHHGISDRVQLVSYYLTPGVYRAIKRGWALAAPTDSPVIQGRIAIDQIVRILEGKTVQHNVGPRITLVTQDNVGRLIRHASLAPNGYRTTFVVGRVTAE
jgi:protein TorT